MNVSSFAALAALLVCLPANLSAQLAGADDATNSIWDHHVHVLSPKLIAHWSAAGMTFSREEAAYSDPLQILESENLSGAFLVSMGHLYATGDLSQLDGVRGQEVQSLQRENDFVARSTRRAPDRLAGFASINPLWESAIAEMERCSHLDGIAGFKLHLPACGVDLADDGHLQAVQRVIGWAEENGYPLLVHLFQADTANSPALSRRFWQELVSPHPRVQLQLAHLGAAGGYNEVSENVLNGFLTLMQSAGDEEFRGIRFDLSGAILAEEIDGIGPTSDEQCRRLAEHMRAAGLERFLFASDYPVFSVAGTREVLSSRLPLEPSEIDQLLSSRSPVFVKLAELATITRPQLRRELLQRMKRDQAIRARFVESDRAAEPGQPAQFDPQMAEEMMKVDAENRQWLAEQVALHGWLGKSMVGTDGAHAAWLLVQHADADREFQKKCLDLMTAAGSAEVAAVDIAYLTDRVLVGDGKPQRYGTQVSLTDEGLQLNPCEDRENLDRRRAELGLPPIEEYLDKIRKVYGFSSDKTPD